MIGTDIAIHGNLLAWSTDHGTLVFTQMKVLENLPVMLTADWRQKRPSGRTGAAGDRLLNSFYGIDPAVDSTW